MRLTHGLFLTFEGLDGSGKTTQMERCAESLRERGLTVVVTRNPGGTTFGQELRQILLHHPGTVYPISELLLFIADRAQHMDEVVIPAVQAGQVVLCDRHIDSTLAYQGYGRGLDHAMIDELNRIALQGYRPHHTFLFDADPAILAARVTRRGQADRLEGESLAFHTRVREGYRQLATNEPNRIQVLDALLPIEALQTQVLAALEKHLTQSISG